jgi:hypothetical protein
MTLLHFPLLSFQGRLSRMVSLRKCIHFLFLFLKFKLLVASNEAMWILGNVCLILSVTQNLISMNDNGEDTSD